MSPHMHEIAWMESGWSTVNVSTNGRGYTVESEVATVPNGRLVRTTMYAKDGKPVGTPTTAFVPNPETKWC